MEALSLSFSLSRSPLSLSIYLPTYLSSYLSISTYLPMWLSAYLSSCLSVSLPIYLSTCHLPAYLPTLNFLYLSLYLYLDLHPRFNTDLVCTRNVAASFHVFICVCVCSAILVCLCVCVSICQVSKYLPTYLSIYLSFYLSINICVYIYISTYLPIYLSIYIYLYLSIDLCQIVVFCDLRSHQPRPATLEERLVYPHAWANGRPSWGVVIVWDLGFQVQRQTEFIFRNSMRATKTREADCFLDIPTLHYKLGFLD